VFLANYKNGPFPLLLYSPDLAPCDFWLFPKLKNALREQRFADIPDTQSNMATLLRGIPEKRFSRLFLAVAPSSHKVHSFTRKIF
jgi:hypothetical protein